MVAGARHEGWQHLRESAGSGCSYPIFTDLMIVDQPRRDLRDMFALIAGTVELVGARLARTVGSGQGAGAVGRATRDLVHFGQSREGVGQADQDHPLMK